MKKNNIVTIIIVLFSCAVCTNSLFAKESKRIVGTQYIDPPQTYAIISNPYTGDKLLCKEGDYINNEFKLITINNNSILLKDTYSTATTNLSTNTAKGEVAFAGTVELGSIEYWYCAPKSYFEIQKNQFRLIDIKGSKAILEKNYNQKTSLLNNTLISNTMTGDVFALPSVNPWIEPSTTFTADNVSSASLFRKYSKDLTPPKDRDDNQAVRYNNSDIRTIVTNSSLVSMGWELKGTTSINNLTETYWEAKRAPHGKYDKIGLRKLVANNNTAPNGVVFYLPPSYTSAGLYTNNDGQYLEKYDFRIYLANRGYVVYSIDYRTSYVPDSETNLSFMAGWGTETYLTDIRDAIAYAKEHSHVGRVFLAGHSSGAKYVYVYASQRWRQDISGMIVMDGSPWEMDGKPAANDTMRISTVYNALAGGDTAADRAVFEQWSYLIPSPIGYYDNYLPQFGSRFYEAIGTYKDPAMGPAYGPFAGFATVTDYLADQFQNVWGDKQYCNVENGYSTVEMQVAFATEAAVPYWPLVEYAEDCYTGNWNGDTPSGVGFNYIDKLAKIDIPIIVFASSEWTTALDMEFEWKALGPSLIENTDRTYILLEGFGHLDILLGEFSESLVFLPLYNWLEART